MTVMSLHGEWLSLMDISGPFLAEPVLKDAFPQGLEEVEPKTRKLLRQAYDEWRDALELGDDDLAELHGAWIDLVLRQGLELDDDGSGDILKTAGEMPDKLSQKFAEHGVTLRPDYVVVDDQESDKSLMLISVYDPGTDLNEPLKSDGWAASPAERIVELCRANETRLGLVTNGEHWMLVDAPVGAATTFASWYARLWSPEPKTLQSFINLLGVRRFFVGSDEQLPALLDASLKLQDEVTEALGEQVRRAVEVLIQALDRADVDRNRELLTGIEPTALYEAGLTVMMRIVFLLSAEERGLLLLGDERYEANYAVSTLRMQLRGESEEILERRFDAWARLLAIFRAVYGGIDHEDMRLPALGGSLFDPNRFPFLEGRAKSSDWRVDHAIPLPIDNRTVLLLLDAVQLFQGRTLSYRALDVEQIGYVYEGLLERTVVRAENVTLDLDATKSAKKPWVTLEELEAAKATSDDAMAALLKERTGSSVSRIRNDLVKPLEVADADRLLTACHADVSLRDRIKPYFHFLRIDRWEYPLVYPDGTFMVTTGTDRRETGTHYTPKSLTEAIVKETLEPVAYFGPAEGKPREGWVLKTPVELLDLKICDPAMGSGAFLVQVCRWLSDRLVEAWRGAEEAGKSVTAEGQVVQLLDGHEPLRDDPEERLLTARRMIAERCIYGVDVNPLAVELAKLSIWLITLAKGRPFGFLDHNLRSGDSLLGIHDLDQLLYLNMKPGKGSSQKLFATEIDKSVKDAVALRAQLRSRPIVDIRDVEAMADLDSLARRKLELPELFADALVGGLLVDGGKTVDTTSLSIEAGKAIGGDSDAAGLIRRRAIKNLRVDLSAEQPTKKPFHWPLEYPEVFNRERCGFDAFVGNPPFKRGKDISGIYGGGYREFLVSVVASGRRGSADLVAYFFLRSEALTRPSGSYGLLSTNTISEGDTREVCLENLISKGSEIYSAFPNQAWPGKAAVMVSRLHFFKGKWLGRRHLSDKTVSYISPYLSEQNEWAPKKLSTNKSFSYQGCNILGLGFTLPEDHARKLLAENPKTKTVLFPYLIGDDLTSSPTQKPSRWVINFWDWPLSRNSEGSWKDATESQRKKWLKSHLVPSDFPGQVAEDFPELLEIVVNNVKPERASKKRKQYRDVWWQFGEKQKSLYRSLGIGRFTNEDGSQEQPKNLGEYALCQSMISKHLIISRVPKSLVFSHRLVVFTLNADAFLPLLQSTIHEVWARKQGGTLETRMSYTPSDVLETFPFPDRTDNFVEIGRKYLCARSSLAEEEQIGLTVLQNRFHSEAVRGERYLRLRLLHKEIDGAVLAAYGWNDIDLGHDFYEVDYLPEQDRTRFTISSAARLEVLQRLAELNKERFEVESSVKKMDKRNVSGKASNETSSDLFSLQEGRQ